MEIPPIVSEDAVALPMLGVISVGALIVGEFERTIELYPVEEAIDISGFSPAVHARGKVALIDFRHLISFGKAQEVVCPSEVKI